MGCQKNFVSQITLSYATGQRTHSLPVQSPSGVWVGGELRGACWDIGRRCSGVRGGRSWEGGGSRVASESKASMKDISPLRGDFLPTLAAWC